MKRFDWIFFSGFTAQRRRRQSQRLKLATCVCDGPTVACFTMATSTAPDVPLPAEFLDAHHHFLDTANNTDFQSFLGSIVPNET